MSESIPKSEQHGLLEPGVIRDGVYLGVVACWRKYIHTPEEERSSDEEVFSFIFEQTFKEVGVLQSEAYELIELAKTEAQLFPKAKPDELIIFKP
jgi:hypothetical protein